MSSLSIKLAVRTWLIVSALGFYACAQDDQSCALGETRSCTNATESCSGQQVCNAIQSGFLPCVCGEAPDNDQLTSDNDSTTMSAATTDELTSHDGDDGLGGMSGEGGAGADADGGEGGADNETTAAEPTTGEATTEDSDDSSTTDSSTTGGTTGGSHGSVIFSGVGTAVSASGNDYGISGSFYVLQDSYAKGVKVNDGLVHTQLTPLAFNKSSLKPCVNGTIARVTNAQGGSCTTGCQWGAIWGGLMGLELANGTSTWNADEHDVSGFSFELSGSIGDARLRIEAQIEGTDENFCVMLDHELNLSGLISVGLDEFTHNCFDHSGNMSFDPTKITALEWVVMADAGSTSPVNNFCIESLDVH